MTTRPSDLVEPYLAPGISNPEYTRLKHIESEEDQPGRVARQYAMTLAIGQRYESVALLLDVQLSYAVAMWECASWQLWREQDYQRLERWIADGMPAVLKSAR